MLSLNFTPFPKLQTTRLLLRSLALEDTAMQAEIRSNEHVNKFLDRPKQINLEDAERYISKII